MGARYILDILAFAVSFDGSYKTMIGIILVGLAIHAVIMVGIVVVTR